MDDDGTDDWANYESGPFCRHWSDPSECELHCAGCGHRCGEHDDGGSGGPSACQVNDCPCGAYREPDELPPPPHIPPQP